MWVYVMDSPRRQEEAMNTRTQSPCMMCVQFIIGISWFVWGDVISALGFIMIYVEGCHQCIGDYHNLCGGMSSVQRTSWFVWRDIISALGNIMMYVKGCHQCIGDYHDLCEGMSSMHWGISWFVCVCVCGAGDMMNILGGGDIIIAVEHPQCTDEFPQCTEYLPMHWIPSNALMIFPNAPYTSRCTAQAPMNCTHVIQQGGDPPALFDKCHGLFYVPTGTWNWQVNVPSEGQLVVLWCLVRLTQKLKQWHHWWFYWK